MMKYLTALSFFGICLFINQISYSQKLSAGFSSGISFADIHGNDFSGMWKFKPGPSENIVADYSLNRFLGFQTGISFSTLYYEYSPYSYKSQELPIYELDQGILALDLGYNNTEKMMDFTWLSFPAQLKLTIPSSPELSLSAGLIYSVLLDYNYDYYPDEKDTGNDLGYLFTSAITLPLKENLHAVLNLSYMAGTRKFAGSREYKHGSMSLTTGFSWDIMNKNNQKAKTQPEDTTNRKIWLIYKGGLNMNWNSGNSFPEKYGINFGPTLGFTVNFRLNGNFSFQTGLSYERNGYSIKDSSDSFHKYYEFYGPDYFVDTKIGIDNIMLPALIDLSFGKSYSFYINTGPYIAARLNAFCTGEAFSSNDDGSMFELEKTVVHDDIEKVIKPYDYGWIAGAGITIPVNRNLKIDLGLRYSTGFRDIYESPYSYDTSLSGRGAVFVRKSSVSFQAGIRIPVNN